MKYFKQLFCKHEFDIKLEQYTYPNTDSFFYYKRQVFCVKCEKHYYMFGDDNRKTKR